jgi:hypothetical protein
MSDFWRGFIAYACVYSLYQDYLGQMEYMYRVQENWTKASFSVPYAIFILWLVFFKFKIPREEEEKE